MTSKIENIAIIPVRGGSKRIKNKNLINFFDKPMFIHTVNHALESNLFDKIHVSTESKEILKICEKYNIEVDFLRPNELARDRSKLSDVMEFVIKKYESYNIQIENICMLWATSPLRTKEDILNSYKMLDKGTNAVISVTSYDLPFWCAQEEDKHGNLKKIFPDEFWKTSHEVPSIFCDNGSICWIKTKAFLKHKNWFPPLSKGYLMPKERSIDIDTQFDLDFAEYLYGKNKT